MNKCEDIKTVFKSEDYGLEDHTLTIDKISELDPQGNVVLVKYIAYVIDPVGDAIVFNYSPYAKLGELLDSAKIWIECGCPSNCDELGIPSKWTKHSLNELVGA